MKANHNNCTSLYNAILIVRTLSKIKFESKSQRGMAASAGYAIVRTLSKIKFESKSQQHWGFEYSTTNCKNVVKDKIWKQITTPNWEGWKIIEL